MNTQLFAGNLICLAAPDSERDTAIESKWTHDAQYMRAMYAEAMRPISPNVIKKKYEEAEKESRRIQFHFAIRTLADDRLIGFTRLFRVEWNNGTANLSLAIPDESDRGKGYGTEAIRLMLNYAFCELNLYRLSANTFESNKRALAFLQKNGFTVEVRRRQAIHRDGKRCDLLLLGLLREEWDNK